MMVSVVILNFPYMFTLKILSKTRLFIHAIDTLTMFDCYDVANH